MPCTIRMLLLNLQILDKRWLNIPPEQIKTTHPRVIVNHMNTYLARFKKQHDKVQAVMDKLPEDNDRTGEVDPTNPAHDTVSQKDSEEEDYAQVVEPVPTAEPLKPSRTQQKDTSKKQGK